MFPEFPGAIDYKLCPSNPALVACVYDGDVWVLDAAHGQKHQLTHTAGELSQSVVMYQTF